MKRLITVLLASTLLTQAAYAGSTTLAVPSGSGTFREGTDGSTNLFPQVGLCDGAACANIAAVKAASTAAAATDPALVVSVSPNNTIAATQSGTWNIGTLTTITSLPALTTGSATIGKVDLLGNAGAIMDFAGQNASSPANSLLIGGQFNTTPTTITSGNTSPLQIDNAGNLLVNIKAGASSGAVAQGSTTSGQTGGLTQAAVTTSAPSYTTAQTNPLSLTTAGGLRTDIASANGTALGAVVSNLGTLASGTPATPNFNMYIVGCVSTVCNTNGSAISANSSPVVIASDQAAVAVKAASGAFASGALASGSIASGAIASGAIASGAVAAGAIVSGAAVSGAFASGAVVDITNMSAATAAAPPSKAIYLGANASGATGGQMRGLINCDNHVFKHITTATDTLAVQGVASQTIYVCGWRSRAAGVATWYLENTGSANANCSSTNTQITGVATEAANTGEVNNNPIWGGLKNTSGNGLCINSTGTGGVDVDIWYTQL